MKYNRENVDGRIIAAAYKLFTEKGYPGTSVTDILEEAKVTRRTCYLHYSSKLDLFVAVVDNTLKDIYSKFKQSIQEIDYADPDGFLFYLKALVESLNQCGGLLYTLWAMENEEFENQVSEKLYHSYRTASLGLRKEIISDVDKFYQNGAINFSNAEVLTDAILAIYKGMYVHIRKEKNYEIADLSFDELFAAILRIICYGILDKKEKPE